MELPRDILIFVNKRFPAGQREQALSLLGGALLHDGTPPAPRILRCACYASRGDVERLAYLTDLIGIDFRDVIVAGEYELQDGDLVRVRNLSKTFSFDEQD